MDKKLPLDNLFPEVLREDPDFSILIDLSSILLGRFESKIDDFNSLIDPDTCPILFLPLLGRLVGYNYRYDIHPDFNREIIKNLLRIYAMRGSDQAIIYAATYGDCDGYIGGDIFIPGTRPDRDLATIEYPRDWLFRHDMSTWSGSHKRADDDLFREGVMEILVERLNDKIRERIESVKPAGYIIRFRMLVLLNPEESNHLIPRPDTFLDICTYVNSIQYSPWYHWDRTGSRSRNFAYCGLKNNSLDILRYLECYADARRVVYSILSPIYKYYGLKQSDIGKVTDLELPLESKMSSTDGCVAFCPVRYGHVENTAYDLSFNENEILAMSNKYEITSMEIVQTN